MAYVLVMGSATVLSYVTISEVNRGTKMDVPERLANGGG